MQSAGALLGLETGIFSMPPSLDYTRAAEVDMGFLESPLPGE